MPPYVITKCALTHHDVYRVCCGRKVMLFVSILSFVYAFAKKRGRSDKTGIFFP